MDKLPQILICDDDSLVHVTVKQLLKAQFECKSAMNPDEASVIIQKQSIDLLLLDVQMRTPDEGLRSIARFLAIDPELTIVMMSGVTDYTAVREALKQGAADYVVKGLEQDNLPLVLERALLHRRLLQKQEQQNFEVAQQQGRHQLIGESEKIRALRKVIDRIRNSPANVVITGETGTGKEVVARNLRKTNPDSSLAPFVAVDSSTIMSSTAESILFGFEKGAFTGAEKLTKGIFEEANGGVVYFDEIANMPLEIQAKLLRVIQEKEICRLGSSKIISLDFRVICATNKNLEQMVKNGQFKDDLLQRLNVLPLEIPPLRDRIDDIPLLVQHFVSKATGNESSIRFSPDAIAVLSSYSWPGNVRELGNLISFLLAMTDAPCIDVADLPPKFRDAARPTVLHAAHLSPSQENGKQPTFYEQVATLEKNILQEEYERQKGNISRLALALGMDRSHLYVKLKEHKIHPKLAP